MTPPAATSPYKHHRFPGEIISHAVWLYFRCSLSHRDAEELLFVRGLMVLYEAMRTGCRTFGQQYANQLRRRRPRPGDKRPLDEVCPPPAFHSTFPEALAPGQPWAATMPARKCRLWYLAAYDGAAG